MTKISLTQGAYTARSLLADAQRCVNLFPEIDPSDAVFPITHYPTPGLTLLKSAPVAGPARLDWVTTTGAYIRVVGPNVYNVNPVTWTHTLLGQIAVGTSMCSMADNGLVAVLVDGTRAGYVIDLATFDFSLIYNPLFFGATRVRYLETFFIFQKPNSSDWYISIAKPGYADLATPSVLAGTITGGSGYVNGTYSNVPLTGGSGSGAMGTITVSGGAVTAVTVTNPGQDYAATDILSASAASLGGSGSGFQYSLTTAGAFSSLDVAQTTAIGGDIVSLEVAHRNIWLLTALGGEIWFNAGNSDFTFSEVPGALIEHGCAAVYSVASYDGSVFYLGCDRAGTAIVFQGTPGYIAERISTHCVENIFNQFEDVSDAIGYIYQQDGHVFYVLNFQADDQTWVYDLSSKLWHERVWIDDNGQEHRHRLNGTAAVGNQIVGGDWQTGDLYLLDLNNYTDNGNAIVRRRGFPHIVDGNARIRYDQFIASLDVGITPGFPVDQEPQMYLRYSDTAGNSWGQPIAMGMGATGQYTRSVQWRRLGMGRDRVFEVFWSAPVAAALNGAFAEFQRSGT